jgi:hypothetical protein
MSLKPTKKYVSILMKMILIFFVRKQTSDVVIVKTIGVNIIPLGAKKCPMNPFKITVNVASPKAVLLFICYCRLCRHSLTANDLRLKEVGDFEALTFF